MQVAQVEPLNAAEREWVASHVQIAHKVVGSAFTPELLDDLWSVLLAQQFDDPNDAINVAGLAFGQLLVERFPALDWCAYSDEQGTEVAVRGGTSDFTIFPTNFVAKRWEAGAERFFAEMWPELEASYARAEAG
jgi:Domain of unknown function (DUF3806)